MFNNINLLLFFQPTHFSESLAFKPINYAKSNDLSVSI